MKHALLALAAAAATAVTAAAGAASLPRGYDDNPSVVDAVAKAKASGKLVIVYYTDQNCQICDALDGWLVRSDIRQAYKDSYHFAMVFADDLAPEERDRWRATYVPRGAPAWVVLSSEGGYLCTASGGFANAGSALDLHKLLSKLASKPVDTVKVSNAPSKPRNCSAYSLGV